MSVFGRTLVALALVGVAGTAQGELPVPVAKPEELASPPRSWLRGGSGVALIAEFRRPAKPADLPTGALALPR